MSLHKFRTLLTTISTPKQPKPQVTTTVRILQAQNFNNTQSIKMSTGIPNAAPTTGTGPMKPTDPKNSMIGGHAQYVKGMVNEKIGAAMGSQEWIQSGKADMNEGKVAMKEAQAAKPAVAPGNLTGKIEETAGKVTGCPGMVDEGIERQTKQQ